MESTLDQEKGQYHENESAELSSDVGELAASAPDPTPLYVPTEHYGSWGQYEQIQSQPATVFESTQTWTDQVSGNYFDYLPQKPQTLEACASVSAAETTGYTIPSAAQTYQVAAQPDVSQGYGTPSVAATTAYNSFTSTSASSVQDQQNADTAYITAAQFQQSWLPSSQGLLGQPMYVPQTDTTQIQSIPLGTPSWPPAQAPVPLQAQYDAQGVIQTGGNPYQVLGLSPGVQYHTLLPLTPGAQGPQAVLYQVGPDGTQFITAHPATGQTMVLNHQHPSTSGHKIWSKETAQQAKEATINATKKAYDKSKEFIVNKDGARAVAKTTWRQSKDVMVKTTDMIEKYAKPLLPLIAAADPEVAAMLRVGLQAGRFVKNRDQKQRLAQAKVEPDPHIAAQPQLDAAALVNLAPLMALLQQTAQLNAASGNQNSADVQAQARLLAALLQVQQQQQPQIQQPQVQQPQIQQPQDQQPDTHQQQQQYQAQQPVSPPQSAHGQTQQPHAQQPVAEQPYEQQQLQPAHSQSQFPLQSPPQLQHWQQPASQPQQPQQQHKIPRRKPISSKPAAHQPTAPAAHSRSATDPPSDQDQLAAFLVSHLTLQDQPQTQSQPQTPAATAWTHHTFPAFGIQSILLPPGAALTPSQTAIAGPLPVPGIETDPATFTIDVFPDSAALQQRIDTLQSIPLSPSPSNPTPQLLEPLAVKPELNPCALVAADCLVGQSLVAGQRSTRYVVLLQSGCTRRGCGVEIASSAVGSAKAEAAREAVRRVAGSVQWAADDVLEGDAIAG